jgi:hypothetical protein
LAGDLAPTVLSRLVFFLIVAATFASQNIEASTASKSFGSEASTCAAAEYHQFDFWIGDWAVTDTDTGALVSHVAVKPIQGNCGIREQYFSTRGKTGESMSMYNQQRCGWSQTWLSSSGEIVQIAGTAKNGAMRLSGWMSGSSPPLRVRGIWSVIPDGVREVGEKSTDGRKWRPWFDLRFRRAPATS